MKTTPFRFILLSAALALVAMCFAGCANSERTLDPAGAYAGDELLWRADGVIIDINNACDELEGLAARNPAVVAARPDVAAFLSRARQERDGTAAPGEVLATLFAARDAYARARSAATAADLDGTLALARALLAEARAFLPLFVSGP